MEVNLKYAVSKLCNVQLHCTTSRFPVWIALSLRCTLDSRMAGQTFPKKRQTQGASFGACSDPVREADTFSGGATRPLTVNFCTRRGHTRRTVSAWHHAKPLSVALDLQQQVCVLSHRPRPTGGEVSVTRGRAHTKKKKSPSVTL